MEKLLHFARSLSLLLACSLQGFEGKTAFIQTLYPEDEIFCHDKTVKQLFSGPISFEQPWVCFSSVAGIPAIFFDPAHSPTLAMYAELCQEELLERDFATLEQALGFCLDFVSRKMFLKDNQPIKMWQEVAHFGHHRDTPITRLDDYVKMNTGACKQQTLALLYLLAKLFPLAELEFQRGPIHVDDKTYAHAWGIVTLQGKTYWLDPALRFMLDQDKDYLIIDKFYRKNKKIAGTLGH